jgi:hypothetical protein
VTDRQVEGALKNLPPEMRKKKRARNSSLNFHALNLAERYFVSTPIVVANFWVDDLGPNSSTVNV